MGNWYQIWIWFEGNLKGFRVQIDILAVVCDRIFKQQLNLLLFLSDRYCRNFGLTDLPGHDGKVTSNKKMIFFSHERNKGGDRDYCSHFSVIFETTSKFPILFLRLVFGKKGIDGVTRPRREIGIRYESELKIVLKDLGCK